MRPLPAWRKMGLCLGTSFSFQLLYQVPSGLVPSNPVDRCLHKSTILPPTPITSVVLALFAVGIVATQERAALVVATVPVLLQVSTSVVVLHEPVRRRLLT